VRVKLVSFVELEIQRKRQHADHLTLKSPGLLDGLKNYPCVLCDPV
jgi:hypothetical protein